MSNWLSAAWHGVVGFVHRWYVIARVILILPTASLTTYWNNSAGMGYVAAGDKLGAYRKFVRALESDPLDPIVQTNLALVFEWNEEYEKAAQTYESLRAEVAAADPNDPKNVVNFNGTLTHGLKLTRIISFNLGNVMAKSRKIAEALKAYQAALDDGGQPEKVKTNIELLFQKGGGQGDGDANSDQQDPQNDPKKGDPSKDGKSKPDDKNQDPDKNKDDKDTRDNQKKREDSLKNPPDKNQDKDKGKGKPKPFDSQDLKPEDVKRILDEIKNQEQSIRAQEYDKQPKDGARGGKDW